MTPPQGERIEIYAGVIARSISFMDSRGKVRHSFIYEDTRVSYFVDYVYENGVLINLFHSDNYERAILEAEDEAKQLCLAVYDLVEEFSLENLQAGLCRGSVEC
ncbi:MAG: hypothetical protein AAGE61_00925 [Pseudomonadota bacterium]